MWIGQKIIILVDPYLVIFLILKVEQLVSYQSDSLPLPYLAMKQST